MDQKKIANKIVNELVAKNVGHHHKVGNKYYVDTNFISGINGAYPSSSVEHMGFGEFFLQTPDGRLDFNRMAGKKFEGQVGRSHLLQDNSNGKLIKKAIKLMESKSESELV